jgi:hypothetical protein
MDSMLGNWLVQIDLLLAKGRKWNHQADPGND